MYLTNSLRVDTEEIPRSKRQTMDDGTPRQPLEFSRRYRTKQESLESFQLLNRGSHATLNFYIACGL